jgi:formiminotetrahydrofolate cyclodeaminase
MKAYKNHTLEQYARALARREPVPGGGSVAALNGALGTGLIGMVAGYSLGKTGSAGNERKLKALAEKCETLREQFLALVDDDAKAYLKFSRIPPELRRDKARAARAAAKIPRRVCRLARSALDLIPFLVIHGNRYLISDLEIAVEQIWAAYRSAGALLEPDGNS